MSWFKRARAQPVESREEDTRTRDVVDHLAKEVGRLETVTERLQHLVTEFAKEIETGTTHDA